MSGVSRSETQFGPPNPAPDLTRRGNLSLILSLVHQHSAMTRAELTRATGLNRSTVASLIARLGDLGLVYESASESNAVGRPSPAVHPGETVCAIAVNPEVDAVTIGLVSLSGRVVRKARYVTDRPPTPAEVVNITTAVLEGMRTDLERSRHIAGIGVAVPGLTRSEDGVVTYAPHLAWRDVPIAAMLGAATGYPVWAANDASLGAGAELLFGAGRGALDLIYLNGGASGIGGGVISRGSLRSGASGYAGELGHTLVNSAGRRCHCGAIGCLESEISLHRLQDLVGLRGADVDDVETALAEGWSPGIRSEVGRQLDVLGVALRNAVNAFNPARIILGGFLGTLYRLDPERLEVRIAKDALAGPARDVTVRSAELGSGLLMIGAAELAFTAILDDPGRLAAS